ncbi:MAG TPA: LPS export ABC transporter periplasmic protein LptC [Ohtaekwangia sp.]|nr:LPS export ABC transporter periplasmic protein LptC [Ohtaekwangia sp.]
MKIFLYYILFIISLITTSCGNNEIKEPLEYNGPVSEVENVELYYSEKDMIKVKMTAALLYEFKNGDREFPQGVYIEFFDETGKLESTLKANHAYFFKEENQWRGRDNVEVKNLEKREQLNTEELFWKPAEKRIFTDKFVTIRQQKDVLYGEGLEANEDLSDYTITNISGEMEVEE